MSAAPRKKAKRAFKTTEITTQVVSLKPGDIMFVVVRDNINEQLADSLRKGLNDVLKKAGVDPSVQVVILNDMDVGVIRSGEDG